MKICYHLYELKKSSSKREGALLKVQFDDALIGYADCHPWTEFLDEPLKNQLKLLKSGITTRLTRRSLFFAEVDAKARFLKKSLLSGLTIPKSNYLITDIKHPQIKNNIQKALTEGFTSFKVKLGDDLNDLLFLKEQIPDFVSLRVDFNSKLDLKTFKEVIKKIKTLNLSLEYIEDPFTFNTETWKNIQSGGLTLACDQFLEQAINHPDAAKVLIIKPAIHEAIDLPNQKTVITSYLDHPFGQCTAAFSASKYPETVCGLLTHHIYEKNSFSEQLTEHGPDFKIPEGFGFGFDSILRTLKWLEL